MSNGLTPDDGSVRVDGADYRDWDPDRLAAHIGYLPQDPALFPGTIAENIARFETIDGAQHELAAEQVVAAARMAGVHDMILSLPGGYDRRIGWSGDELSAGQRQRIALARALYRAPKIVVLDEPNSALDGEGETALMNAIAAIRRTGSTVIMITHRSALLTDATRLMVLVGGRVSAIGPYREIAERLAPRPQPTIMAKAASA